MKNVPEHDVHAKAHNQPLTEEDYLNDPLLRLERNNRSTRNAVVFFFGTVGLTLALALVIALASRIIGGPRCVAGESVWLCSHSMELAFWIIPAVISMGAMFLSVWITYDKWRRHQRWRPWIAVIWFLMPYGLAWVTSAGAMLIFGH